MKNTILFLTLCTFALFISCCSSTKIHHLEPERFMEIANYNFPTSTQSFTYIGRSYHRIYFERTDVITLKCILGISDEEYYIYWTEVDKIPKSYIEKLENQIKWYENYKD